MAVYQIVLRIGWIFKTESIIMPAFMDLIGGAGWQRGCLPMLNRLGQSCVPLLFSDHIANLPRKSSWLCVNTLAMGGCFLVLAGAWWGSAGQRTWWWPIFFLVVYALFFTATGMCQVIFSTLTGKLIIENQRGRLAAVGSLIGGLLAIVAALIWLHPWLGTASHGTSQTVAAGQTSLVAQASVAAPSETPSKPKFGLIFGFTGALFIAAAVTTTRLAECDDQFKRPVRRKIETLYASGRIIFGNTNFRLLALTAALFGMSMTLFPHYQSIARARLNIGFDGALSWIIAQHVGASLLSVPAGWMADRFGNRRVLRILMGAACIAPTLLLVLHTTAVTWRLPYLFMFFWLALPNGPS